MQPENNMQNSVPGPKLETVVEEVTAMETKPVASEPQKNDIVFNNKPKKSSGMILGMVLLAILAIGGIGFGVWAMLNGNQQTAILNNQVADLKQQNSELMEKIDKTPVSDDTTIVVDGGDSSDVNNDGAVETADYIYVGKWGLKIKIPEGLNIKDYAFNTDAAADGQVTRISVGLEVGDYGEYYLGTVVRISKSSYDDGLEQPYEPAFSDNEYYYIVSHPNGDVPASLQSEMELILDMLSNSENYSRI